jgi:hypothetical protein
VLEPGIDVGVHARLAKGAAVGGEE